MSYTVEKLRGKKIAVVGGSSGIGFGAAHAFLQHGAHVIIISSSQERVDEAVKNLKSATASDNVTGRVGNVRDEEAFVRLLNEVAPVDHLVFSSVDKIIRGELSTLDLDEARYLFGVKFWGSILVAKAALKHDIIRSGGSLTLTSGSAGIKPGKGASVGGALNGGLLTLTKGLAADLADKGVRVNTVVPGLVRTELWQKSLTAKKIEEFEALGSKLPVGFVASPHDIAEAYVYLVRADYATGSLVEIDGGALL